VGRNRPPIPNALNGTRLLIGEQEASPGTNGHGLVHLMHRHWKLLSHNNQAHSYDGLLANTRDLTSPPDGNQGARIIKIEQQAGGRYAVHGVAGALRGRCIVGNEYPAGNGVWSIITFHEGHHTTGAGREGSRKIREW
jgi:hypothetical protein